jgi:ribosomal protein S7
MVHQAVKKKLLKTNSKFYPGKLFLGILISSGSRLTAKRIALRVFTHIRKKYKIAPLLFLKLFFERMRPKVALYSKKIAGVTHKIPVPLSYRKSVSIFLHWWVAASRKASRGRPIISSLISELDSAYRNPSSNLAKKRDDVHRLAHFNRPFLRFLRF